MFFDFIVALMLAGSPAWGTLGVIGLTAHSEPAPRYTTPVGHLPTDATEKSEGVLGRFEYRPPRDPYMKAHPETKLHSPSLPEIPWPGSGSAQ